MQEAIGTDGSEGDGRPIGKPSERICGSHPWKGGGEKGGTAVTHSPGREKRYLLEAKETEMRTGALPLLVVLGVSLSTPSVVWAQVQPPGDSQQVPKLYQQCQERLRKDPKNEEAKKLCDEGMRLNREGKQEEAIRTIQDGLAKFKQ